MEEKIEVRYQRINGEDCYVIDFPDRETGIGKGYNQDISKDVYDYIKSLRSQLEEKDKIISDLREGIKKFIKRYGSYQDIYIGVKMLKEKILGL